jgi:regulator of RNase E activity RraA
MDVAQLEQRLAGLDTPCLCDAEKALRTNLRVVDPAIRPINLGLQMLGRAHTVSCHEDFLTVMEGLKEASAGDVLVIDSRESHKANVIEPILRHCGLWEGPVRTLAAARGPPTGANESSDQPRELQLVLDPEYL